MNIAIYRLNKLTHVSKNARSRIRKSVFFRFNAELKNHREVLTKNIKRRRKDMKLTGYGADICF